MNGRWQAWYNNGDVVWKAIFADGVVVNQVETWYPDDRKLSIVQLNPDGMQDGDFKSWWPNGEVRTKGHYSRGNRHGC